ncbi:hypothetical protein FALBO_6876 [Fusarium albosuccineum]|uniref:Uncharacterized protein n=1 Tax=Fusarium albosuccineum TaxID=1237068 RepID=A0A8H4LDD0_9HYPO|nr:hypothetical protein FALBO_6876 [Fusarium albosuccineum]
MSEESDIAEDFDDYEGEDEIEALWHYQFVGAWRAWGHRDVPHEKEIWIEIARQLRFGGPTTKRMYNHVIGKVKEPDLAWGHVVAVNLHWPKAKIRQSDFAKRAQRKFPMSDVLKVEWNEDGPVIRNLTLKSSTRRRRRRSQANAASNADESPSADNENNDQEVLEVAEEISWAELCRVSEPRETRDEAILREALQAATYKIRHLEEKLSNQDELQTKFTNCLDMCGLFANILISNRLGTREEVEEFMVKKGLSMPEGFAFYKD